MDTAQDKGLGALQSKPSQTKREGMMKVATRLHDEENALLHRMELQIRRLFDMIQRIIRSERDVQERPLQLDDNSDV